MGYHNVELPSKFLGYGSVIGPGHRTVIIATPAGIETRSGRWAAARRRYDVTNIRNVDDATELQDFILARQGALHAFKVSDPLDKTTASDHVSTPATDDFNIGTGDASETEFQLLKRYAEGESYEVARNITKPKSGTVTVGVGLAQMTEGTHYTVNYDTGILSFGTAPGVGEAVTAGCEFYVPVRFDASVDDWLQTAYSGFDIGEVSVPMVEVKDTTPITERFSYGGGSSLGSPSVTTSLDFSDGRVVTITPGAAIDLRLPDIQTALWAAGSIAAGGPYFTVLNLSGTYAVTLKEYHTSAWRSLLLLPTLALGTCCDLFVDDNGIWRRR